MMSATYRSFQRADAVLERLFEAHGGRDALARLPDMTLHYHGVVMDEGHYAAPGQSKPYPVSGTLLVARRTVADRRELDGERTFTLCQPGRGVRAAGNGAPAPLDALEACREAAAFLAHAYLLRADEARAGLRWIGEDRRDDVALDVIGYLERDGTAWSLHVDRVTGLLASAERLALGPCGDDIERIGFAGYAAHGAIQVASRVSVERVHAGSRERWDIELDPPVVAPIAPSTLSDDGRVEVADDAAAGVARRTVPIAPDVYGVELPAYNFRSLLIVFDEYVIAFDAPLDSAAGEAILAAARELAPDKPVRYLVLSHHHPPHAGGLRPFVASGAILVTTAGNVAWLRELAEAPRRLSPDRQSRAPRPAQFLVVDRTRALSDAHHHLVLRDIGPATTHTNEYLIAYAAWARLLIEADLGSFKTSGEVVPAGPRARGLARSIAELHLDVATIVQCWPLDGRKPTATLDDLTAAVRAAEVPP